MSENTPAIYKAICAVMRDINAIGKDRKNDTQHFNYRGIDDVMNELHGTLAKNGVFVVPDVLTEERSVGKSKSGSELFYTRLKIRFSFYAEDGSHVDAVVIGEAMDSGDKASNKALSVGLKYAMLQVFCIPTEDEKDPDGQSPQPAPQRMKKEQPKLGFEPKGGETTPEEKEELGELFRAKYQNGKPVFSKDEAKKYSDMRRDKTAREVIELIRAELNNRTEPPQQIQDLADAVNGEVVEDIYLEAET